MPHTASTVMAKYVPALIERGDSDKKKLDEIMPYSSIDKVNPSFLTPFFLSRIPRIFIVAALTNTTPQALSSAIFANTLKSPGKLSNSSLLAKQIKAHHSDMMDKNSSIIGIRLIIVLTRSLGLLAQWPLVAFRLILDLPLRVN